MERLKGMDRLEALAEKLRLQKEKSEEALQAKMAKRRMLAAQLKAAEKFKENYWEKSMGQFLWDLGFRPEHEKELKNHIRKFARKVFIVDGREENMPESEMVSVNGTSLTHREGE